MCKHPRLGVIMYKVTGIIALYTKLCPAPSFSKQLQSTLYFVITHYHCYTSDSWFCFYMQGIMEGKNKCKQVSQNERGKKIKNR